MSASAPPTVWRATVAASRPTASPTMPTSSRRTSAGVRSGRGGRSVISGRAAGRVAGGATSASPFGPGPAAAGAASGDGRWSAGTSALTGRPRSSGLLGALRRGGADDRRGDQAAQDAEAGAAEGVERQVRPVVDAGELDDRRQRVRDGA